MRGFSKVLEDFPWSKISTSTVSFFMLEGVPGQKYERRCFILSMFIGVRRCSRVFPGQRANFQASKTANICAKYFFIVLVIYIRPLICEDFEAGGTMVPPPPY